MNFKALKEFNPRHIAVVSQMCINIGGVIVISVKMHLLTFEPYYNIHTDLGLSRQLMTSYNTSERC